MPKSARRQNRENGQTKRTNVCQEIDLAKGLKSVTESGWTLHRIPAGILHAWNHYLTVNTVLGSGIVVALEENILLRLWSRD